MEHSKAPAKTGSEQTLVTSLRPRGHDAKLPRPRPRFSPWLGTHVPHAGTKIWGSLIN